MTKRIQRAIDKAEGYLRRLNALSRDLIVENDATREKALIELESLVLVSRGSSETDHRKQLALLGLQSAFEAYLAPDAPNARLYATSEDKDSLLAEAALRALRAEYPDEAEQLPDAEVATAVRLWAETYPAAR